MNKLTVETNCTQTDDRTARVEFFKSDAHPDRWMHQIVIAKADQTAVVLSSVEGTDQEIWPPSPPLQDPSFHELADGGAVLAVGMAGKSHWSASTSLSAENEILFDMACLVKTTGGELGSTYRVGAQTTIEISEANIVIQHPLGTLRMTASENESAKTIIRKQSASGPDCFIRVAPITQDEDQSEDNSDSRNSLGASKRWQYRVLLSK